MRVTRPAAAIAIAAAGLAIVAAGTTGLLLTRQAAPAMRPPPRGVATVPAPATAVPGAASAAHVASATPQAGSARSASPASRRAGFQTVAPSVLADPVSLTIPLIGVRTSLITLGRAADGSMEVPASTTVAGWYTGSALPGAIGPAVIVGHVDSVSGPGVFFRLSQLRRGDRVYVTRADGTTAVFRVTSVRTYAKDVLPVKAVYGATPDPEVRLITCGGAFDDATGRYLSNVVVDATEAT